jgi:polar amino acid transport system substrate-binding protein
LVLGLLTLMVVRARAQADSGALEWVAGDLPPFSWMAPGGPQGYANDLALAMAERLGRPAKVSYFPWARAVKQAQEGDHFGVFPLARTADREAQFRWLVPLMTVRYAFGCLAETPAVGLEQLRHVPVGVLRGSPLALTLRAERFRRVIPGRDYKELLRMLSLGSIKAIYAGTPMLDAAIEQYGYRHEQFARQLVLGESTLYMAASLRLAEDEAQRWLKAYQQLEDDGTVTRLRKRYLR